MMEHYVKYNSHGLWRRHHRHDIHLSYLMILMYHNFTPKIDNVNNGLSCISELHPHILKMEFVKYELHRYDVQVAILLPFL